MGHVNCHDRIHRRWTPTFKYAHPSTQTIWHVLYPDLPTDLPRPPLRDGVSYIEPSYVLEPADK